MLIIVWSFPDSAVPRESNLIPISDAHQKPHWKQAAQSNTISTVSTTKLQALNMFYDMFTKRPEYKTHTSISLGDRQLQPAQQFYLKTMIVVHNRTDDGKPSLLFIGYHCSLPYITYVTPM